MRAVQQTAPFQMNVLEHVLLPQTQVRVLNVITWSNVILDMSVAALERVAYLLPQMQHFHFLQALLATN
jgi:hypothetical protein